jgi:hypothetical protein
MSKAQELVRKTTSAGTMNNYGDRFEVGSTGSGQHVVALDNVTMKEIYDSALNCKMTAVCADFIVLQSDCMKAGTRCSEKYDVGKPGAPGDNASKRLNGLARAVIESLGHTQKPEDLSGKAYEKLVGDTLIKMLEIDPATDLTRTAGRRFVGRGIALKVYSKSSIPKKGPHAGKVFVNNDFSHIGQTPDQIKAKRAALEAVPEFAESKPAPTKPISKPEPVTAPIESPVDASESDDDSGADDMLAGLE